jgi:hypothetical protein
MDGGKAKKKPVKKPAKKKNPDNVEMNSGENDNSPSMMGMTSQEGGDSFNIYCLRCKKKVAVKGTKKKSGNRNMIVGQCAAGHKVTQFCK